MPSLAANAHPGFTWSPSPYLSVFDNPAIGQGFSSLYISSFPATFVIQSGFWGRSTQGGANPGQQGVAVACGLERWWREAVGAF